MSAFDPKRTSAPSGRLGPVATMGRPEPFGGNMRRREFIAGLSGVAALPVAARAQQGTRLIRVGFVGPGLTGPVPTALYQAFRDRLREHGFREGQNVAFEYAAIDEPRGPFLSAADMLRKQPDLIVAAGPEVALQAVIGASGFVPIVIIAINFDPIERGYVASLSRPGGNIT